MPEKMHKPDEIVRKLRQVNVLLSQGRPVGEAVRSIGVTLFTYYRWRKEFGGLKGDQVKRLKELEKENDRLRKAVSDLTLERLILNEAASGNFRALPAFAAASTMSWRSSPSRSGLSARFSDSTVLPSASGREVGLMTRFSLPTSSGSPPAMAAMAIAGSRRCCGWMVGR
jgi:transposase-like protein